MPRMARRLRVAELPTLLPARWRLTRHSYRALAVDTLMPARSSGRIPANERAVLHGLLTRVLETPLTRR